MALWREYAIALLIILLLGILAVYAFGIGNISSGIGGWGTAANVTTTVYTP